MTRVRHSITYRLLEFQPSHNIAIRGNVLLINISLEVWRRKVINRYVPTNYSSNIDEGVFDYKCYDKVVF